MEDGPTLCRRAFRTVAYQGVMRLRVEAEIAEREQASPGNYRPTSSPSQGVSPGESPRHLSEPEFRASSALAGIVEWTAAG